MSPAFFNSDLPLPLIPCHLSILLHCSVSILLTLTFTCQPNFLSVGQIGYPNLSTEYNKFLNIYFQFCLDNTSSFGNLFAQIFEPPPPHSSFPPLGFRKCWQSNNFPANWSWNILCPGQQHLTVLSKATKLSDRSAKTVNLNPFTGH